MGFAPWKFNISANKLVIYAAAACGWSALRRYSGSLASKSAVKAVSCLSLSFKISWRLAIKAYIRILSDLLKVMSAISSARKKNNSPRVLWSSFWHTFTGKNSFPSLSFQWFSWSRPPPEQWCGDADDSSCVNPRYGGHRYSSVLHQDIFYLRIIHSKSGLLHGIVRHKVPSDWNKPKYTVPEVL